jgi:hypothetical protein
MPPDQLVCWSMHEFSRRPQEGGGEILQVLLLPPEGPPILLHQTNSTGAISAILIPEPSVQGPHLDRARLRDTMLLLTTLSGPLSLPTCFLPAEEANSSLSYGLSQDPQSWVRYKKKKNPNLEGLSSGEVCIKTK